MREAPELPTLMRALRHEAGLVGASLAGISRGIGRHGAYLSRTLAARHELTVEDTFKLFAYLKVDARDFLLLLFPFGGPGAVALSKDPPPQHEEDLQLRKTVRNLRELRGELQLSPAQRRTRVAALLKTILRRKAVSQRAASVGLGLGPSALGQALRGGAKLTWRQVFGVLALCRVTPGRFVMELFGPDREVSFAGMLWSEYLDEIEAGVVEVMAAAHRLVRAERREPAGR